jgi:hypothetical protein
VLDARHGFKYTDMKYLRDMISMTYAPEDYDEASPSTHENKEDIIIGKKRVITEPSVADKELLQNLSWKLQIVLTKCDLVERSVLARRVHEIREDVIRSFPYLGKNGQTSLPVMMISGLYGNGIIELQKELASLIPPKEVKPPQVEELQKNVDSDGLIGNLSQAFAKLSSVNLSTKEKGRGAQTTRATERVITRPSTPPKINRSKKPRNPKADTSK